MGATGAAIEAAQLRFRPIVTTSLAFTLGVLPLAISTGTGSASRHSIGTGVIRGMLAATLVRPSLFPYLTVSLPGAHRDKGKQSKSIRSACPRDEGSPLSHGESARNAADVVRHLR